MEKMYFKADLKGLINELSKYFDKRKVIYYINVIDLISKKVECINRKKNKLTVINGIRDINLFLLECYVNKLIIQLENKEITIKGFYEDLKKYIKWLKYVKTDDNIKLHVLSDEIINQELQKIKCKVLHIL